MTDIAFLLLLFFLTFAIASIALPIPLDPATTEHNKPTGEQNVQLIVDSQGTLYLFGKPVSIDEIPTSLAVSLLADKETPFSKIAPIIDRLRQTGTESISCIVQDYP